MKPTGIDSWRTLSRAQRDALIDQAATRHAPPQRQRAPRSAVAVPPRLRTPSPAATIAPRTASRPPNDPAVVPKPAERPRGLQAFAVGECILCGAPCPGRYLCRAHDDLADVAAGWEV